MRRSKFVFISLIMLSLTSLVFSVSTDLFVSNSPPYISSFIPNQSWQQGGNKVSAFDLDSYFTDDNGDSLNYSASSVSDISVNISSDNVVSFYSDEDFLGVRNVVFYAFDGVNTGESNNVSLFVGSDNESPQWSSTSKDKTTIYQNRVVNFSADWTDNFGLDRYIFSIDLGSGWVNLSDVNFSGLSNTSVQGYQISAPAGRVVYWMFYAFDGNDNMNFTDINNFTVDTPPNPSSPPSGGPSSTGSGFISNVAEIFIGEKFEDILVDPKSLYVKLYQGEFVTRTLRISNNRRNDISFSLSTQGVESFLSLDKSFMNLSGGETKSLIVDFHSGSKAIPEVYFGNINLNYLRGTKVPVVIEVTSSDFNNSLNVTVQDEFKSVKPGGLVKADIKVKRVGESVPSSSKLFIAIKDFNGETLDSNQREINFSSALSIEANLTVPSDANAGTYIFYARIFDDKRTSVGGDNFEVGERFIFAAFAKFGFFFLLILFLGILVSIMMIRYKRTMERRRILELYVLVNQMRELLSQNKVDEAIEVYLKIKYKYDEPITQSVIENKAELKKEVERLSKNLDLVKFGVDDRAVKELSVKDNSEKDKSSSGNSAADKGVSPVIPSVVNDVKSDKKIIPVVDNKSVSASLSQVTPPKVAKIFKGKHNKGVTKKGVVKHVHKKR